MRLACALALLQRLTWYAKSHARDQSALRPRNRDIAMSRPRFGYRRVLVMLQREGWNVGKKRVYRVYSLEGQQLRTKVKRRSVLRYFGVSRRCRPRRTSTGAWISFVRCFTGVAFAS